MASYSETLDYIYSLRGGAIDLRLEHMGQALSLFGHPEKKYPSFHVAGTNGKGSTSAMLHRILSIAGYRSALYTSPHVVSFGERIRIGDGEISPDEVVALADEIKVRTAQANIPLTFFEFATLMALVYFARRKVDVAVVEVGLGGRLDATNFVAPVVSLITTISKDHEAYLGSDLVSIAREKGGIIKSGIPVICGALAPEAAEVLRGMARALGSRSYFLRRDFTFTLKERGLFDYRGLRRELTDLEVALRGRHQRANAALALGALEIAQREFPVGEAALREGLRTVIWPGRFEIVQERPTIILDGAHNGEGVNALLDEIEDFRGARKVRLLFAAMEDKDWRLMLGALSASASEVVLTRVSMDRSADPNRLADGLTAPAAVKVIEDSRAALGYLLDSAAPDDLILVAGSLYLLGEVRPTLRNRAATNTGETNISNSTV